MLAMLQKEWMELVRSGRLFSLVVLFTVFGVMNPGIAKLTPWLMEMMAEEMAASGMVITTVEVDALTSWTQFFKNMPMALLAFVVLWGGSLTGELQSGTLTLVVTKGLQRWKIYAAKLGLSILTWTAGIWYCYGITYGYNAYYWDNGIAGGIAEATAAWWLFGFWVIAIMYLFSVIAGTATGTYLGTGMTIAASYLAGLIPKAADYCPTALTGGMAFVNTDSSIGNETATCIVTIVTLLAAVIIAIPVFNRKQI